MHFISELQTLITFLFVSEKIKLERGEYFGTKNYLGLLKYFVFTHAAPPFSVGETLHVAYKLIE